MARPRYFEATRASFRVMATAGGNCFIAFARFVCTIGSHGTDLLISHNLTQKHEYEDHKFNTVPNLLGRDFAAEEPNQKWAGTSWDICCANTLPVSGHQLCLDP